MLKLSKTFKLSACIFIYRQIDWIEQTGTLAFYITNNLLMQ